MQRINTGQPSERDAEATSSKASKAEFAKNYDQAFQLYIKTAESFLHLSRVSTADDKNKLKWKANAAKALERAEKIKRFVDKSRSSLTPGTPSSDQSRTKTMDIHLTPIGIDHFSPQEQFYVLKKGGTVNGIFFPLWDDPVVVKGSFSSVYSDPDGQPKLSPEQQKVSPIWRRSGPSRVPGTNLSRRPILPQEILQHIVTDCSVCASISVCLEHDRRFGSSLESSIHSASELQQSSHPVHSDMDGRYDVRVLFNGAWRRIVIDDRLPFHPTKGTLMCMSVARSPPESPTSGVSYNTLWPSLLEKAYMKLMGGYDFPGSNSSIDLHTIAGWIPEHVEIKSSMFEREKTWERIKKGFSAGHCVITLGTGPSPYIQWRHVSFLPSHSYAVIDAYETEEGRIFTVLDSWAHASGSKEPSRVLQIPWSEVVNTFDGVYLSWDPNMWQKPLTFHGMWKRSTEEDDGPRQVQIEFTNQSDVDDEIWVLLTRHVVDTHQTPEYIALRVDVEDLNKEMNAIETQSLLYTKGTYTNSTHILSRTRILRSQRSGILSISASCDGEAREVGFTLTAYAKVDMNMSWIEHKSIPPFTQKVEGTFTSKTGGGNCTYSSFMVNPQYRLVVHPIQGQKQDRSQTKPKLTLTLRTHKDIPVNVTMVWSQGRRITELSAKDLVATSGAYSYGLARLAQTIIAGEYIVVASAFEPHYMGTFSLNVESSYPFDLSPIPQEGAGMYNKVIRGSWDGETAGGGPSFDRYSNNPIFELEIPSVAHVIIRLQLLQPSTATALNVTVYPSSTGSVPSYLERQKHIATSGPYDDTIAGVATQQVTFATGRYYIVPSTYNPGVELGFRMLVYSSISGFKVTEVKRSRT